MSGQEIIKIIGIINGELSYYNSLGEKDITEELASDYNYAIEKLELFEELLVEINYIAA